MTGYVRWKDVRGEYVARAGGEEAFEAGKQEMLAAVVGHRLHGNADAVKGGFDAAKELIGAVPIP